MNGRQELPPEGRLIETAREDAGLSIREAARRAGYSEGWWRQVVERFRDAAGPGGTSVPAMTVARFAVAAGVTPEQMAAEGMRPDAAREMGKVLERRANEPPAPDPLDAARPPGWANSFITPALVAAADAHHMPVVRARLAELAGQGNHDPDGGELFPGSPGLAASYETDRLRGADVYQAAWTAVLVHEHMEQSGRRGNRRGA